jgi:hypothetical protein
MKRLHPHLVLFLIIDFLIAAAIVIVVLAKKG